MGKKFGYGLSPRFPSSIKMIQIDVEAEEIGRNRMVEVGLVADSRTALEAIYAEMTSRNLKTFDASWIRESLAERLKAIESSGHGTNYIHPFRLARAVNKRLSHDTIFVQDGASILVRSWAVTKYHTAGAYMDTMPLGSMGMGTPLALGAVAGAKEYAAETGNNIRRVVMVTGDGAFGFYPAELDSATKGDLPFLCIISNNGGWGNEIHSQPREVGRTINAHFGDVRYDKVAEGFGAVGFRVESVEELEPILDEAFSITDRPVVVDVITKDEGGFDPLTNTLHYHDVEETRAHHFSGV